MRAAYRPSDSRLLDRHGEGLHELRVDRDVRRLRWTPLSEISPALIAAVVASEDHRFRQHGGVDVRAVAAAAWSWASGGAPRGASTISMQLAALLDPELRRSGGPRPLPQKWAQMRAAWALEHEWTKNEILEAYLNLVTFRGELQGVAAAAAVLFDKQPHGLDDAESAVLAVLLRSPNADRDALVRRGMRVVGPTQPALQEALMRVLDAPRGTGPRVKLAPHVARQLLRRGEAVEVQATLDADLQRFATTSLREHLLALQGRNVADGAVLVADNESGEILAYVGSSGDLSPAPEVDGVRARRQAGSSLKPLLYAAALDQRLLTPATLLDDSPLEIQVGGGLYRPQNYDEHFRGLVSVRTALASSLNVPAVRVLQMLGPDVLAQRLRRLGFALDRRGEDYGPSLALGSADVSLWELVGAYRSLAAGGVWQPLRLGTAANADGTCGDPERCRVYSTRAAFLTADILADRDSRTTTFGLENPLATRFWTAVKTGTSKDMRDNWCIGFSRRYTVGVWVGNFSGRPMHDVSGISGAAPVWLDLMERLHRREASLPPAVPAGIVARHVSFTRSVEAARDELFIAGTERDREPPQTLAAVPRILAPAPQAVIALDPDIPAEHQRVVLAARGGALVLDGGRLASANELWAPLPGAHSLELLDAHGRAVDSVSFTVRGSAPRSR